MRKLRRVNSARIRKRLRAWYDLASAENIADGRAWYDNANRFVCAVAWKHDSSSRIVSGVLAALSPAVRWELNKRQAEALCQAHADGWDLKLVTLTTYKGQAEKAYRILREQPDVNGILNILGKHAFKTRAFFLNVYLQTQDYHVTIDRWIIRACGLRDFNIGGNGGQRRYNLLTDAIRTVAEEVNESARAFQAIVWLVVHDMAEVEDPTKEVPF